MQNSDLQTNQEQEPALQKAGVLRCRLPKPTDNVWLCTGDCWEGKYEVEATSEDGETLYLVDRGGMVICHYTQVRLLER